MASEKKAKKAKENLESAASPLADRLIAEAKKWVGTTEKGKANSGPEVEAFQKAVDGKAQGEPWCMAFVQFCLMNVLGGPPEVAMSEHCLTVWNRSPRELRLNKPEPGCLMIWRHKNSDQGHVGIVTAVKGASVETIEGNVIPHRREIEREGDGVYEMTRDVKGSSTMHVVGWLRPWKLEV